MSQQKQRSATERLGDLEQATMSVFQALDNQSRDLSLIKDAIKLLGNKLNSVVQLLEKGDSVNDANIAIQMVANNVAELDARIQGLKAQGILVRQEEVTAESFIVAREVDDNGTVINPRLQSLLASFPEAVQGKLLGAKAGDIVNVADGKLKVELLDVYTFQAPEVEQPQEQTEAAAEAPASEAAGQ
jgi:hypothetical protein